jgi:hypothetical protein
MKQNTAILNSEKDKPFVEKRLNRDKVRWERWKANCYMNGISGLSKENSDLIIQYLKDMEMGLRTVTLLVSME